MISIRRACVLLAVAGAAIFPLAAAAAPETERVYLSGKGPRDAVPWDFVVSAGRRAGEKAKIPVPSNWEQHGFGTYRYGEDKGSKADETGVYTRRFAAPEAWKGKRVRLVFDGVMTDAAVKVNGVSVGPTHQGAFYRFRFDVTDVLKYGSEANNEVEVTVSETSANAKTNAAERAADYWIFGGIFRPVWLEILPTEAIENVAIDARADGSFAANVSLLDPRQVTRIESQIFASDGRRVGAPFSTAIPAGGGGIMRVATRIPSPLLWTGETPHLYTAKFTLYRGNEAVHEMRQRFGFRTFEVRPGDGLYLNGQRILLKGVNRHSFRPDTARSLDPEDNYADVRLIRAMNMNAVRMSHYPPDESFIEAADELGLYVLDELSGWQNAHDTQVGRRLVREMIERDVNHPSILFWDNGNEGGWNRALDGDFALYDPQKRRVLHPWELHDDLDTKHYPPYDDVVRRLSGAHLFMPTEVLHGLFDGGSGAGLHDYWSAIEQSPRGAGAFIWVFADEGIARTDQGGRIDVFSTLAPDGIVGPRHERDGSFDAIRDVWSPVQVAAPLLDDTFDGTLAVTNKYDFTSLADVRFEWRLLRFPRPADRAAAAQPLKRGIAASPAVPAHSSGTMQLALPGDWRKADALLLTATDRSGAEVWTWTWRIPSIQRPLPAGGARGTPAIAETTDEIRLAADGKTAVFDRRTGLLRRLSAGQRSLDLAQGPRLAYTRPRPAGPPAWLPLTATGADGTVRRLATPQLASLIEVDLDFARTDAWAALKLEVSPNGNRWITISDGSRRQRDGNRYAIAPQVVAAVRLSGVRKNDGAPIAIKDVRVAFEAARFPAPVPAVIVRSGTTAATGGAPATAWLEAEGAGGLDRTRWTMQGDGSLTLDYAYSLEGEVLYHGVTFDAPAAVNSPFRALAEGPHPVWQNRLQGANLAVRDQAPLPGYYAGLQWARFNSAGSAWTVSATTPDTYLRVGTRLVDHPNTSPEFPAGDVSFLRAIPAMGSKFVTPEQSGPSGKPARATGRYIGSLVFTW
ncbi:glycoside hydrolase family 2 protein [Sphingomonas sp.]|uniref:glycoside hydrolase family 2 protein n=1 Tax=Sphingomonas sp. TaxID=28214 RepID=UPI002EDB4B28